MENNTQNLNQILIGKSENLEEASILLNMANRHGLISGATGSGKTVTLQVLAESFARCGVNVFAADVKGDLAGVSQKGVMNPKIESRVESLKLEDYQNEGSNVIFWDIFGKQGHPLRITVTDIGANLLSRILGLSDTQEQVLELIFLIAKDKNLPLIDLKDLKALFDLVLEDLDNIKVKYGYIATQSLGVIQRKVVNFNEQGADDFIGEPSFKINDLFQKSKDGKGYINILDSRILMNDKRLYSSFLLWLLSKLFEELDEVGDVEKPKLVFFFDEAHLLFKDASATLLEKIEKVVRLIRSKGVGVYFVTQNPKDVPDTVLSQLGNRVQHVLRAYTPDEQKALKSAAKSYRSELSVDEVQNLISSLAVGEALVSTLDKKGVPQIAKKVTVVPPRSLMGAITDEQRKDILKTSPFNGIYDEKIDNESAFEILQKQYKEASDNDSKNEKENDKFPSKGTKKDVEFKEIKDKKISSKTTSTKYTKTERMILSSLRSFLRTIGKAAIKILLGSFSKKGRR